METKDDEYADMPELEHVVFPDFIQNFKLDYEFCLGILLQFPIDIFGVIGDLCGKDDIIYLATQFVKNYRKFVKMLDALSCFLDEITPITDPLIKEMNSLEPVIEKENKYLEMLELSLNINNKVIKDECLKNLKMIEKAKKRKKYLENKINNSKEKILLKYPELFFYRSTVYHGLFTYEDKNNLYVKYSRMFARGLSLDTIKQQIINEDQQNKERIAKENYIDTYGNLCHMNHMYSLHTTKCVNCQSHVCLAPKVKIGSHNATLTHYGCGAYLNPSPKSHNHMMICSTCLEHPHTPKKLYKLCRKYIA